MNGYLTVTKDEWINLNGATITDIDGNEGVLNLVVGTKAIFQVQKSVESYEDKLFELFIWHGTTPPPEDVYLGAEIVGIGPQIYLDKSVDDIYVKALNEDVILTARIVL